LHQVRGSKLQFAAKGAKSAEDTGWRFKAESEVGLSCTWPLLHKVVDSPEHLEACAKSPKSAWHLPDLTVAVRGSWRWVRNVLKSYHDDIYVLSLPFESGGRLRYRI
jgi:hypothetical protein